MSQPKVSASKARASGRMTAGNGLTVLGAVALMGVSSAVTLAIVLPAVGSAAPAFAASPVHRGVIPDELRDELLAVRDAPEADRAEMLDDIREGVADGDYGGAAQRLLERIDAVVAEQTPELQAALDEIRVETDPDDRRDLVQQVRADIEAGAYGDEARDRTAYLEAAFRDDGARGLLRALWAGR